MAAKKRISPTPKRRVSKNPRTASNPKNSPRKIDKGILFAIIISALLLGIFGGYALFNAFSAPAPKEKLEHPKFPPATPPKAQISPSPLAPEPKTEQLIDKNLALLEELASKNLPKEEPPTPPSLSNEPDKLALLTPAPLPKVSEPQTLLAPKKPKAAPLALPLGSKPRLAIIIDDVGFMPQAEEIKKLPFRVTPSIFPKGKFNPKSHEIAKEFDFFMVHLPLEAREFYQKEHEWLRIEDKEEKIETKIKALKRDFPRLTHLNNHTGSKFTENLPAMRRFLKVLEEENLTFVDSRTTPYSKAPQIFEEEGKLLLSRDVFLDNERSISYIKKQLQEAVKIAKKRGYAIAIGHPHAETFQALRGSSHLKEEVEFVYVKDLFKP